MNAPYAPVFWKLWTLEVTVLEVAILGGCGLLIMTFWYVTVCDMHGPVPVPTCVCPPKRTGIRGPTVQARGSAGARRRPGSGASSAISISINKSDTFNQSSAAISINFIAISGLTFSAIKTVAFQHPFPLSQWSSGWRTEKKRALSRTVTFPSNYINDNLHRGYVITPYTKYAQRHLEK